MDDETLSSTRRELMKATAGATGIASLAGCGMFNSGNGGTSFDQVTTVFHHQLERDFSDAANDVSGTSAETGIEFVQDNSKGSVVELNTESVGDSGGYYDIQYEEATEHIDQGDPVSISGWVNPTNQQSWNQIFNGGGLTIGTRSGTLRCGWYDPTRGSRLYFIEVDAEEYLPEDEWTHVSATVDPTDQARFYINGKEVGSDGVGDDGGFQNKGYDVLRVGFHPTANANNHFAGRLSDLRFYSGILTENNIQTLYQN